MTVALAPTGTGSDVVAQEGRIDGNGRFEFVRSRAPGRPGCRSPRSTPTTADAPRPFATPPFLI